MSKLDKAKWDALHAQNYHPNVAGIIERIEKNRSGETPSLFSQWEGILNTKLPVKDKVVLEIGHGGGWYLAQQLQQGAKFVIGLEINDVINNKTKQVFNHFGINEYKLYEVDDTCFDCVKEKVDIIFSITVFQHIHMDLTENYFATAHKILNKNGYIVCQFYMNDVTQVKQPDVGEGNVCYSKNELNVMFKNYNFEVKNYGESRWDGCANGYWSIYLLKLKDQNSK